MAVALREVWRRYGPLLWLLVCAALSAQLAAAAQPALLQLLNVTDERVSSANLLRAFHRLQSGLLCRLPVAQPDRLSFDSASMRRCVAQSGHVQQCAQGEQGCYSLSEAASWNLSLAATLLALGAQPAHCEQVYAAAAAANATATAPPGGAVWLYSILFVTGINLCSLFGACLLPFVRSSIYKHLLRFMVALAVGVLAGSGLLFLIPDALQLNEVASLADTYRHKVTMVVGGVYLFFMMERLLQLWSPGGRHSHSGSRPSSRTQSQNQTAEQRPPPPVISVTAPDSTRLLVPRAPIAASDSEAAGLADDVELDELGLNSVNHHPPCHHVNSLDLRACDMVLPVEDEEDADAPDANGLRAAPIGMPSAQLLAPPCLAASGSLGSRKSNRSRSQRLLSFSHVRPVAWMVIFGDALHNFIDGLSIGAAFAENLLSGVSVALAVLFEELPHELGDFAILLSSGMTLRQALGFNFVSACTCYVGLAIGIMVGQLAGASVWIFALAGGMFLYISLTDMLPEMNHDAQECVTIKESLHLLALQNAGLMLGYGLMLVLSIFGKQIQIRDN